MPPRTHSKADNPTPGCLHLQSTIVGKIVSRVAQYRFSILAGLWEIEAYALRQDQSHLTLAPRSSRCPMAENTLRRTAYVLDRGLPSDQGSDRSGMCRAMAEIEPGSAPSASCRPPGTDPIGLRASLPQGLSLHNDIAKETYPNVVGIGAKLRESACISPIFPRPSPVR